MTGQEPGLLSRLDRLPLVWPQGVSDLPLQGSNSVPVVDRPLTWRSATRTGMTATIVGNTTRQDSILPLA